ncbi:hypothetical protein DFP72DRAFT_964461 [Ephemerocybe angulata]|uniref:Uncharacterized protein n=1 Tax=Ephemerocybe angulata TaxID=980116 RepID=A0A8H6HYX9_9AGAR|nr:hypothetical protein DFP72DRAFT_964461 [Tulosesus angulatus]
MPSVLSAMRTNHTTARFTISSENTIHESRAFKLEQEGRRSLKRQRTDDDDLKGGKDEGGYNPSGYLRDPVWYVGDEVTEGEVVVRVDRTLFKLPKELMKRIGSVGDATIDKEKYTDKSPLSLDFMFKYLDPGLKTDHVELFRTLLWAFPIMNQVTSVALGDNPSSADYALCERILSVASLADRYNISDVHAWAASVADEVIKNGAFLNSVSSLVLRKLYEVGVSAERPLIRAKCLEVWLSRVWNKTAPAVPALQMAEKYPEELTELKGVAYYTLLQDMADQQAVAADGIVLQLKADPKLTNAQVLRLLSGHYSLVSFWERFKLMPISLPWTPEGPCSEEQHVKCNAVWSKRWLSAVGWRRILGYNSADVLGMLQCLKDSLSGDDDIRAGLTPACRMNGLELLTRKREDVKANLSSHFLGCL